MIIAGGLTRWAIFKVCTHFRINNIFSVFPIIFCAHLCLCSCIGPSDIYILYQAYIWTGNSDFCPHICFNLCPIVLVQCPMFCIILGMFLICRVFLDACVLLFRSSRIFPIFSRIPNSTIRKQFGFVGKVHWKTKL